ncbi:hypothetical protein [Flavobacterium ginsenosidimutans]|uniref:hypothetical protein n=1 Tax=Flavobacterium ginsenosidimutans TaxID=687844 RepID=UPI000DACF22F|nr:hypothetical protein [Flavobacterium ginsenosidimutans]KAF2328142.1 hypothetical protein DM444_20355 [Flavobacterium ginsenosidimutans]
MESLKPLTDFFSVIEKDYRISTTHIAIYAALLQLRSVRGSGNPIEVFRRELAPIAKISSRYTYHKCLRELDEYGYLHYEPSFKKTRASRIYFFDFEMRKLIE